ncbi:MAG: FlgD immunoglobulin-like domain containing protein [bacterium]
MSPFLKQRNLTLVIYAVLLLPISSFSQITPTFEWVNFYGNNSTLNGEPLPIGTRLEARDPDSVLCGEYLVTTPGKYGFLAVYRDDPFTPDVDEGDTSGDTIRFFINGIPALALGPDSPVWTANGDSRHVELAASLTTSVSEKANYITAPQLFELKAYPNPTRGKTRVIIDTSVRAEVSIKIYNIRGKLVRKISHPFLSDGSYLAFWDGQDQEGKMVATGIYIIEATILAAKKMHKQSVKILIIR